MYEEMEITPDIPMIPPVEVDMVVDDTPIVFNNDEPELDTGEPDYREEILKSGLVQADVDYFVRAYKCLKEVRFIKIHCTACDKHLGSAPNDINERYQHPLLKVLLCGKCFQFYCSGEFVKGEDGSELYCRWCGEGGLVFCCTKCPFVFCKNCITRNLGRGMAKTIQNTENWVCFSCSPWQISRHRATYWAIQKYSEDMIAESKITGDINSLSEDANICCTTVKKRTEIYDKLKVPVPKKPKVIKVPSENTLLQTALLHTPSTSKVKNSSKKPWVPEAQDEVVCTPDIIPIDDSPPNSPVQKTSPPIVPYVAQQQIVPKLSPVPIAPKTSKINLSSLQQHIKSSFQQKIVLKPTSQLLKPNTSPIIIRGKSTSNKIGETTKNNYIVVNKKTHPAPVTTLTAIASPSVTTSTPKTNTMIMTSQKRTYTPIATTYSKTNIITRTEQDWFDKAVEEYTETTEYISTKICGLSDVHSRAHKSLRLMDELHNTMQTYMHVAIEKLHKIKRNMQINYDKEMEITPKPVKKTKKINDINEDSNSQDTQFSSDNDSNSARSYKKFRSKIILTKHVQPDEVLFDMDVTNASDEEYDAYNTNSSRATSVSYSENEEQMKHCNEVIDIISSDDEFAESKENTEKLPENTEKPPENTEKLPENTEKPPENTEKPPENTEKPPENTGSPPEVINELVKKVQTKFNIQNLTSNELLNYLRPQVILYNNRRAQKVFKKSAVTDTTIKPFNLEEIITKTLSDEIQNDTNDNNSEKTDFIDNDSNDMDTNQFNDENKELLNKSEPVKNMYNTEFKMEENYDVEEMLGGSVVLRPTKGFGDEFSKFIDSSNTEKNKSQMMSTDEDEDMSDDASREDVTEKSEHDKSISENEKGENDVSKIVKTGEDDAPTEEKSEHDKITSEKEKEENGVLKKEKNEDIPTNEDDILKHIAKLSNQDIDLSSNLENDLDMSDLCHNKDNESLSLPPGSISDEIGHSDLFINKNNDNSDLVLDSGILALKQMAENCVNSSVEMRQSSTECNG